MVINWVKAIHASTGIRFNPKRYDFFISTDLSVTQRQKSVLHFTGCPHGSGDNRMSQLSCHLQQHTSYIMPSTQTHWSNRWGGMPYVCVRDICNFTPGTGPNNNYFLWSKDKYISIQKVKRPSLFTRGRLCRPVDSADHRSVPPEFKPRAEHIWRLFYVSAHLTYHVYKSGRKIFADASPNHYGKIQFFPKKVERCPHSGVCLIVSVY